VRGGGQARGPHPSRGSGVGGGGQVGKRGKATVVGWRRRRTRPRLRGGLRYLVGDGKAVRDQVRGQRHVAVIACQELLAVVHRVPQEGGDGLASRGVDRARRRERVADVRHRPGGLVREVGPLRQQRSVGQEAHVRDRFVYRRGRRRQVGAVGHAYGQ